MSKLLVIVGSTRPTRSADLVLPWLTQKVSGHEAFDAEIVDLRDWPLPIFGEHFGTIGDFSDPTYSEPIVKAWNDKIKGADAYVIVTPEYNHSVPGGLKNAIDSVWVSFGFRNKPVAFVSYGGTACGARAVEQLRLVAIELGLWPIRSALHLPLDVYLAVLKEPVPPNPEIFAPLKKTFGVDRVALFLDDLLWSGRALKAARASTG